jgi:hypothetical protein
MADTFEIEKQREDKWCWAAVSVTVDHYFSPGSTSTQCRVARNVLGVTQCCSDPDVCNTPAKLQTALTAVRKLKDTLTRPLEFDEIRQEIEAGRPVCVRIGWSGGGAHFVMISGYRLSASGAKLVEVADPLFPNSTILYDVLVSAYQNAQDPAGGGQWTATFLVGV